MAYLKTAPRRYFLEFVGAALLLLGLGGLHGYLRTHGASHTLVTAVTLLALIPVALIGLAIWRLYARRDEMQRQDMLKVAAAGGLMSLLLLMAWPFLRPLGMPDLSRIMTLVVLSGSFIVCGTVYELRRTWVTSGAARATLRVLPLLMVPLLPGLYWAAAPWFGWESLTFPRGVLLAGLGGLIGGLYRAIRPADR